MQQFPVRPADPPRLELATVRAKILPVDFVNQCEEDIPHRARNAHGEAPVKLRDMHRLARVTQADLSRIEMRKVRIVSEQPEHIQKRTYGAGKAYGGKVIHDDCLGKVRAIVPCRVECPARKKRAEARKRKKGHTRRCSLS
jgi:hypothetical protein